MKVGFIVHGSASIGMGHIIRSLSLAEAFEDCGHKVNFFSKYKLGIDLIRKKGFMVQCIPSQPERMEEFFYGNIRQALQDAAYIENQIKEPIDVLVVDSYNVNADFFNILKRKTRYLVYLDDLNAFSYPVDMIINGSISADYMKYEETQSAKLLLGCSYNLIRKEFLAIPPRDIRKKMTDVLITTGNSDPYHMTERILNILEEAELFEDLSFHVIVGSGFKAGCLEISDTLIGQSVYLYHKPEKISEIMLKCDFAIAAGGSTLYELAACGVPAIAFSYAENQISQIKAMERDGLLKYIGFYQRIDEKGLIREIRDMQEQYEYRKMLIRRLQRLVDAKGALRVVKEIEIANLHF